jgi:hypothetical protein
MKTQKIINLILLSSILTICSATWAYTLEKSTFKFMLRGYCYAGSKTDDPEAQGGFGSSENYPSKIGKNTPVKRGKIYLIAQTHRKATFAQQYKGMKLLLINASGKKAVFPAQDSRLYIIQEAKDEDGEWRPIEYLPSSWCGNSYHQVFLGSREYWTFVVPRYTGSFKTRLRFKLEGDEPIYSNEFEGSINKEQFSIKQGYTPTSGL